MKVDEILKHADAQLITTVSDRCRNLDMAFSSDLMSDVLTLDEENILLITGLSNLQLVRTAEMADIQAVLIARGKRATPEMIELANENGIVIMETPYSIYKASGILFAKGLKAVY
ncbi:MAG: DRTGG domain-containing protein [Mariniphaga sp.]|nr:DRTGG domain-containing protein [Mariniphaga sp.]